MGSVVDAAERARWDFVPFESVGPLRFAMGPGEVAARVDAEGFTTTGFDMARRHGALVRRAGFRAQDAPLYVESVTAC